MSFHDFIHIVEIAAAVVGAAILVLVIVGAVFLSDPNNYR